jgi:hypothetical protein
MAGGLFKSVGKALGGGGGLLGFLGPVGQILGAVSTAQSLFAKEKKPRQEEAPRAAQATPFSPSRPEEAQRPDSLSEFGTFTPEQQRSALATKGLNSGLGSDEEGYYRNLIQRSLIGDGNQVQTDNPNFLLPVESQYFSRQGHDTSDIMKFLESLSS